MHLDYLLEAEYADGFIYRQTQADTSIFDGTRSAFFDIDKQMLEPEHGKLVRLSAIGERGQADIDFTELPDNARPIYFREMERDFHQGEWVSDARIVDYKFGYQYTKEDGKNYQEIRILP